MEHGKRYTKDEKKEILQFRESHTFQETSEKYGVSMMTLFRWNQRFGILNKAKIQEVIKMDMVIRFDENMDEKKKAKAKELAKVLEVLKFIDGVKVMALINDEGQLVTMISAKDVRKIETDAIIAITAAVLALGERTSEQMHLGNLEMVFIKSKMGFLCFIGFGPHLVLTLLLNEQSNMKHLFTEDFTVIERIKQAISENYP